MAVATETTNGTEIMPSGMVLVRLTQTGTTSTYVCPYFDEIIACIGNNETDNDGVGIGVAAKGTPGGGRTVTITTVGAADVVTLLIAGRV